MAPTGTTPWSRLENWRGEGRISSEALRPAGHRVICWAAAEDTGAPLAADSVSEYTKIVSIKIPVTHLHWQDRGAWNGTVMEAPPEGRCGGGELAAQKTVPLYTELTTLVQLCEASGAGGNEPAGVFPRRDS